MVAVVAGFYVYARYRVQRAIHELPAKLGVDIQQNTEGFTYSQAAGGHTIFSISAANAIRYKQGGKAELHKVKIISYGRQSDRLDEITGDDFEYDAESGDITAKGRVSIELQAVQPATATPGTSPKKVGSPLHLETSGLIFNKITGVAKTSEKIAFVLPQGSGSAVGATYDSKKNTFQLRSDIHLLTSGPKPMNLRADSALFEQESQELMLTDLRAQSGIRRLEAQQVILHLRDDNTVERADASGGVNALVQGVRRAQLHAAEASFTFGAQNQAISGRLAGGVTWETSGSTASRGNAGRVILAFGPNNQIKSAQLRDNVDLVQFSSVQNGKQISPTKTDAALIGQGPQPRAALPQPPLRQPGVPEQQATEQPQSAEFRGDGLDLVVINGSQVQTATSIGAAQVALATPQKSGLTGAQPQNGKTVITASRFEAKFAKDNRISTLAGSSPVKIVSAAPGQPARISQSHDLLATFSKGKTQTLEEVVQSGDVQMQEAKRSATADQATFNQSSDSMALTGNVRYKDDATGSALTSDTLVLNRATGETSANGGVKTTYAEQKATPSGGVLSASQAVHVTAEQMVAKNSTGTARYSGRSRLWQGGNIVQAPVIEFNRNGRTLDARAEGSQRVSTVFVQPDKNGKNAPVEVNADRLRYEEAQRKAFFEGSILVHSADSTLRANKAVITLKPRAAGQEAKTQPPKAQQQGAPNEVQTIDATGDIQLEQPSRKAIGERLVYTTDEGKFVLTGLPSVPPSIFDAEHGQVTGVSLTFFNRDGRVLVDGSNSTSITQTRFKK
jgi:lipopolysaccharide export system protein LptA